MNWSAPSFVITITHMPTGESVKVTSDNYRSTVKAKLAAEQALRSRLWALENGFEKPKEGYSYPITYRLPSDEVYPEELDLHRKDKL